jgi:hypothetical protein
MVVNMTFKYNYGRSYGNSVTKYGAIRTYSELCQRTFDSKLEARVGDELMLRQLAKEISGLEYQVPFQLCKKPNIKLRVDFKYTESGVVKYVEAKGKQTREARVKMAWCSEKYGIVIEVVK